MFMTANKFGFDDYPLMNIILELAVSNAGNFEKIESELKDMLRWPEELGGEVRATVKFFDESFFPKPKGHMRRIRISFLDQYPTIVDFSLAKKNTIKTLKDLALDAVISNVSNHLVINKMEIPETLKMTLKKEFYNEWSRKRFPSYNITLLPFADSLKAGGMETRTIEQIMDDYMARIELTLQQLAEGFPDLNAVKEIVFVWEQFFKEIARLRPVSQYPCAVVPLCPMRHLSQTLQELFHSTIIDQEGPNRLLTLFLNKYVLFC